MIERNKNSPRGGVGEHTALIWNKNNNVASHRPSQEVNERLLRLSSARECNAVRLADLRHERNDAEHCFKLVWVQRHVTTRLSQLLKEPDEILHSWGVFRAERFQQLIVRTERSRDFKHQRGERFSESKEEATSGTHEAVSNGNAGKRSDKIFLA